MASFPDMINYGLGLRLVLSALGLVIAATALFLYLELRHHRRLEYGVRVVDSKIN